MKNRKVYKITNSIIFMKSTKYVSGSELLRNSFGDNLPSKSQDYNLSIRDAEKVKGIITGKLVTRFYNYLLNVNPRLAKNVEMINFLDSVRKQKADFSKIQELRTGKVLRFAMDYYNFTPETYEAYENTPDKNNAIILTNSFFNKANSGVAQYRARTGKQVSEILSNKEFYDIISFAAKDESNLSKILNESFKQIKRDNLVNRSISAAVNNASRKKLRQMNNSLENYNPNILSDETMHELSETVQMKF